VPGKIIGDQERHADRVEATANREGRAAAAVALFVCNLRIPVEQVQAFAVDRHFQLFFGDLAQDPREVAGDAFHRERVLAVGGELILDQHAAACSKRQTFDAVILRGVDRHIKDNLTRLGFATHRETADLACSGEVSLHESRRHSQRTRHIVKAMAGVICR